MKVDIVISFVVYYQCTFWVNHEQLKWGNISFLTSPKMLTNVNFDTYYRYDDFACFRKKFFCSDILNLLTGRSYGGDIWQYLLKITFSYVSYGQWSYQLPQGNSDGTASIYSHLLGIYRTCLIFFWNVGTINWFNFWITRMYYKLHPPFWFSFHLNLFIILVIMSYA